MDQLEHPTNIENSIMKAIVKLGPVFSNIEYIPSGVEGAYISYLVMKAMDNTETSNVEALLRINKTLHQYNYARNNSGLIWLVHRDFNIYLKHEAEVQGEKYIGSSKWLKQKYVSATKPYTFQIDTSKLCMVYGNSRWHICFQPYSRSKEKNIWYNLDLVHIISNQSMSVDLYIKARHSFWGDILLN